MLLSDLALDWLAKLFMAVEGGASWPQCSNVARIAFISKGEHDLDPKGFRGLSILSVCYRLWGVATLQRLQGWIASWEVDSLFAGTSKPVGAEDAWYLFSAQLENERLHGRCTTGGSADIFKCFDQLSRALLVDLCRIGGFPPGPLAAYQAFHEACLYHNSIAGGLGEAHRHPCGIPQGCPLSTTLVAFLLHAWANGILDLDATPRALADDLLVSATGERRAATLLLRGLLLAPAAVAVCCGRMRVAFPCSPAPF